jgi:hypothetical protein
MKKDRFIRNIIVALIFAVVLLFGILPRITGVSFDAYLKNIRTGSFSFEENEYAAIIIGSEPEGIAAAVACARTGLKTLLITEDKDLVSYIGHSMIVEMKPDEGIINGKKTVLNKGIYEEIFGGLKVGFSTEDYLNSVTGLVKREKTLTILYETTVKEASVEGQTVKGIRVSRQGKEEYYSASVFIDATRDGSLLMLCQVPYKLGSEDLNLDGVYMPLEFNFMISGVKWEEMSKIQKTSDFAEEFEKHLMGYERVNNRTKLVSPSFVKQSDDTFIITGLRQWGVDVNDPDDVKKAYDDALYEAFMLTAYMKSIFIPFENCTFKTAPDTLFIPEYRHFEGRYTLTVSDILENTNFKDKIALASMPVDGGKFVDQGFDYVVGNPNVYAIPLGSIIPVNLTNVLMPGPKASYKSLAASSAGSIPVSITVGESAGLTGAYCFLNEKKPSELLDASDEVIGNFVGFLKRGGIYLEEFSEKIMIGKSEEALENHWCYPYILELTEYGLISGGNNNDFRLDSEASCDVMAVLMKNAIVKIAPDAYSLNMDTRLRAHENNTLLTVEKACAILLDALNQPYEEQMAYQTAKSKGLIPEAVVDRFLQGSGVTMDMVYCLTIETARRLAD